MAGCSRRSGAIAIISLLSVFPHIFCGVTQERTLTQEHDEAIERLSKVFGIENAPKNSLRKHKTPPQYMMDLYNSIADKNGITKTASPFNADVVRSFPDKDSLHHMHFKFNSSHIKDEELLAAELHLFKMRPRPEERRGTFHLVELKVYQVLDEDNLWSPDHLRLLDVKRVSAYSHGWEVFRVLPAVLDWVNGSTPNYGFLITAKDLNGAHMNGSHVRFAQRSDHHASKQPILVVFTDDGRRSQYQPVDPADQDLMKRQEGYSEDDTEEDEEEDENGSGNDHEHEAVEDEEDNQDKPRRNKKRRRNRNRYPPPNHSAIQFLNEGHRQRHGLRWKNRNNNIEEGAKSRTKRAVKNNPYTERKRHKKHTCARHKLYVDFDQIGWSGWIISPSGYDAYHCKGHCPFPLGQNQQPTNHATVQSIVHALKIVKGIDTPCCVPNKLYSISLLYFDDDDNVILKQYNDMVAASCGCH